MKHFPRASQQEERDIELCAKSQQKPIATSAGRRSHRMRWHATTGWYCTSSSDGFWAERLLLFAWQLGGEVPGHVLLNSCEVVSCWHLLTLSADLCDFGFLAYLWCSACVLSSH